jgi:translation elongation factor EF-Tu-like GTPase
MTPKPRLTVFVVHDDLNRVVATLNAGEPPQYPQFGDIFEAEKHTIHVRSDVHRGHAGACAALVVTTTVGVDADVRLAVLHARHEGLYRFLLILDEPTASDSSDLVEREVRELLVALGVDGDDVPVVRTPLRSEDPSEVRRLLAALPAFVAPAP